MIRRVYSFAAVSALFICISACSSTNHLLGSDVTPAAMGEVIANKEKNGNTQMELKVKHLAPPGRVLAGATHYVVWATPNGGDPQNIGSLVVNKNLEGEYKTALPYENFLLTVTAEVNRLETLPNGPEIFRKKIE
jgi:hypothetical protein